MTSLQYFIDGFKGKVPIWPLMMTRGRSLMFSLMLRFRNIYIYMVFAGGYHEYIEIGVNIVIVVFDQGGSAP